MALPGWLGSGAPIALMSAAVAALAYGAATVLQSVGVRRFATDPEGSYRRRLWAGRPYAVGLGLDAVGFAASLVALQTLPLFVVESAIASSVGVTAALSAVLLKVRLTLAERWALAVIGVGLVSLAGSASEGSAVRPEAVPPLLLLALVPVVTMVAFGRSRPRGSRLGVCLLSGAAGLAFSGVGIAARVVEVPQAGWQEWWHVAGSLLGIVLVLHGVLALTAYTIALERGRVTTVAAVTFAVETVVPAVVGLVWLGDTVRPGPGWALLAAMGFALTLGGSIALASHTEPAQPAVVTLR